MKKTIVILLVILAVVGMLAGCDRTGNALREQLRRDIEWYDYTTRITAMHVAGDLWVLAAVHVWNDCEVQTDIYVTQNDIDTGGYKFHIVYNGGIINHGGVVIDDE